APAELAVEPRGVVMGRPDREVIEERLAADLRQLLARTGEVVAHLVVVPDGIDRERAEVRLHGRVLAIVAVLGPVLRQRARHEVVTRHAVGAATGVVPVDGIADEEEEVHPVAGERPEDGIPLADVAALGATPEVAAPDEADRSGGGRRRRRDELPLDLAPGLAHRVAVARGRGQGHEWELAREVAGERHLDLGPLPSRAAGDAVLNTD